MHSRSLASDRAAAATGRVDDAIAWATTGVSIAALLVYPIAAFALSIGLLIVAPRHLGRPIRITLAVVAAIALALLAGSRPLLPDSSNDIFGYYETYQELAGGNLGYLGNFGDGFEVTAPLLFWLWSVLLPPLSLNGLMFCLSLTSSLLFVTWLELTYYGSGADPDPALMGIAVLMLNLYFATQLSRQFPALIILLFAMTAQSRSRRLFFLLLACSLHLSALLFYGIYRLARRGFPGWLALAGLALLLRIFFVQIVVAIDLVPAALAGKLEYYVDSNEGFTLSDLTSLRMIFLLAMISLATIVAGRFAVDRRSRRWLAVPWVTAIIHFILLPIPLASLRVTLMVHSIAPGLIAYKMMSGKGRAAMPFVLGLLFFYKIVSLITAEDSGNLLSTVAMLKQFVQ